MFTKLLFLCGFSLFLGSCVSIDQVDTETNVGTVNTVALGCGQYDLVKNCNNFRGATLLLNIDGVPIRIASTEDGKRIMIQSGKVWKDALLANPFLLNNPKESRSSNAAFIAVRSILDIHSIKIISSLAMESLGDTNGYILELDTDGYTVLRSFKVK